jgi:hypothetical protein
MTAIPPPAGWHANHHGSAWRRRYGPAELGVYRKQGRGGFYISLTLRAADTDPALVCALAEMLAADWLELAAARDNEDR